MKRFILLVSALLLSLCLFASGPKEQYNGGTVQLSGRLSIKGNEPFTFLALTTAEGEVYKLTGEMVKELRTKQGKGPVQVSGTMENRGDTPVGIKNTILVKGYRILP